MRNFQDTFETRKRSFISTFSICMTVPLKEELARYFINALVFSDRKSLSTSKNLRFIMKTCMSTKPSNVFITVILKLENAMQPSGVPYHVFSNKLLIRI